MLLRMACLAKDIAPEHREETARFRESEVVVFGGCEVGVQRGDVGVACVLGVEVGGDGCGGGVDSWMRGSVSCEGRVGDGL